MTGAGLDLIHAIDGAQVKGIGGQAIKCIRWHAQHFAGTNLVRRVADERCFRFSLLIFTISARTGSFPVGL